MPAHKKVKCARGHLFNEANTYDYKGHQHCKRCRSYRQKLNRKGLGVETDMRRKSDV